MNLESAIHMGQQTLYTVLMLSGPVLLTALLVGSLVSLFQAVTQIQEITLVFVPKILSVFLVLALAGVPWPMLQQPNPLPRMICWHLNQWEM